MGCGVEESSLLAPGRGREVLDVEEQRNDARAATGGSSGGGLTVGEDGIATTGNPRCGWNG